MNKSKEDKEEYQRYLIQWDIKGEDLSSVLSSSKLSIRSPLLASTFQIEGKITATANELQIEKLESVSYTHLTLPTSDLV